jgi:hypothetical protein
MPVICDGCRVRGSWEHRCHGQLARVNDETAGRACECTECAEDRKAHPIGCVCETCCVAYERDAWDPRMGER